jgi:hypothetical protein
VDRHLRPVEAGEKANQPMKELNGGTSWKREDMTELLQGINE